MGLFSKIVKAVTKPVRSVVRAASETAAGLFQDVTQPFLAPIDNIMDAIAPRFRINAQVNGNLATQLSGGTTHQIVLPQLHSLGQGLAIGDISGGLLSDLAFDSDQLRRAESDLQFIVKAMRKGVYPHRNDALFVGLSAVPLDSFANDTWLRLEVSDENGSSVLVELVLVLRKDKIATQRKNLLRRIGSSDGSSDSEDYAAGMECDEVVPLPTTANMHTTLRLRLRVYDGKGADTPAALAQLQEMDIWIERRNLGYTDVLHRCSIRRPTTAPSLAFPLNLIEYASGGEQDLMRALGDTRDGGPLAGSAKALQRALDSLAASDNIRAAPAGEAAAANPLLHLLGERAQRAETVRAQLWQARRELVRPRQSDGKYDYRMRYKIRISNESDKARTVSRFDFSNTFQGGTPGPAASVCSQFDLPAGSVYEATVYPLMHDSATRSRANVTLDGSGPHCCVALVSGLGVAESVVRLRTLAPPAGQANDSQSLEWSVTDCCAAESPVPTRL